MTSSTSTSFEAFLQTWTPRVEQELDVLLPAADADPAQVHTAMRYAVLGGGKRLRPALVLVGAHLAGSALARGTEGDVLGIACAVEFVHTYSLIHDDLPAMDDDDLRRGRPSCHKAFGEAIAILAGDALNTYAFEILVRRAPRPEFAAALVLDLCVAAGTGGMVGGQVVDLSSEGAVPDLDLVRSIHRRKTAALLACSLRLGARAVGADEELIATLGSFGERLGLAFQIVDDVLDEEGLAADLGKTPGKDRQRGKLTFPAAVGIERSRELADGLVADALRDVAHLEGQELLSGVCELVVSRRA